MLRRLVLLFALGSELKAQELVSSYHHYSAEGVSAMVHRGFRSAADERAWTIVLAASLPLAQLRPSLHLVGVVSHFLQANSLNDIGFNPRSARWEEQLLLLWSTPNGYHAVGLLHFCKHEIDNADPPMPTHLARAIAQPSASSSCTDPSLQRNSKGLCRTGLSGLLGCGRRCSPLHRITASPPAPRSPGDGSAPMLPSPLAQWLSPRLCVFLGK
jgi:hypothetical protein